MSQDQHYSVLLKESVDALITDADGLYIDGTFGRGGHSAEILSRLSSSGKVIAFDKDPQAIATGKALENNDKRFSIVHSSFSDFADELKRQQLQANGLLLDLGVSSPQLDQPERGFSFLNDGPLDMRMNSASGMTASEWIMTTEEKEMIRVFKEYGEERFARRIAAAIAEARAESEITTTKQLADLIEESVPVKEKHKHPATRVFQAIRIEINSELDDIKATLESIFDVMAPAARIVVISFHSLEDRIVKRFFKKYSQSQDFPMGVPVTHDQLKAPLHIVGKAIKAGSQELESNIRSRSAIMRVAEMEGDTSEC
jgi:16S rRNA (cytosine1402-N4)-methyltransferase